MQSLLGEDRKHYERKLTTSMRQLETKSMAIMSKKAIRIKEGEESKMQSLLGEG